MSTIISFVDAVKAAKLFYFAPYPELYLKGKIDQEQLMHMVMSAGDLFLKPQFDSRVDSATSNLLFHEGSQLAYEGPVTKFFQSKYTQNYIARVTEYWGVADLIHQMVDGMVKLISNPLERYKGDFRDTPLYKMWEQQLSRLKRDYDLFELIALLPMDEEERRKLKKEFGSYDLVKQQRVADQVTEAFRKLLDDLTQLKYKDFDVEIMSGIRELTSDLWDLAQWAVFQDLNDILDGKRNIEQVMQPYLERSRKNSLEVINDDMRVSIELRNRYGVP